MPNPIQIRPATAGRRQEDRKLFVGMTSKAIGEQEAWFLSTMLTCKITAMFERFGVVEDVAVLRNPDHTSKG